MKSFLHSWIIKAFLGQESSKELAMKAIAMSSERDLYSTLGLVIWGGQYGYIIVSKFGLHQIATHSPICNKKQLIIRHEFPRKQDDIVIQRQHALF